MRTQTINLYQFSELSKEAKEKALKHFADINFTDNWWDSYDVEINDLWLELTWFDHHYCNISMWDTLLNVCNKIIAEHGETTDTFKTADRFKKRLEKYMLTWPTDIEIEDKLNEMTDEFIEAIEKDFWKIFREQMYYMATDKAIIDTIEANEYEFTEDGTFYTLT